MGRSVFMPSRRELLWIQEGKKCHWCGRETRLCDELDWDQATTDHVVPRYKGGSDDESNLVSACRLCNNRRSHEDAKGLADGSLLGSYMPKSSGANSPKGRFIALSRDNKKSIMAGLYAKPVVRRSIEDVLREQRDQAHREIAVLREEKKKLEDMVRNLDRERRELTVWRLLKNSLLGTAKNKRKR